MVGTADQDAAEAGEAEAGIANGFRHDQRGQTLTTYLDSSALVKLFIEESGSDVVERLVTARSASASASIAYVECRAAFARARREDLLDGGEEAALALELDDVWARMVVVPVDDHLHRASDLTASHPLRAADALHLAAALALTTIARSALTFACWDQRLWDAAAVEGFAMVPSSRP